MIASFLTLDDGTVTVVLDAEDALEAQLLAVFFAQTYRGNTPARVLRLGHRRAQIIASDRVAGKSE